MNSEKLIKLSKFLSLVLRHSPESIGLSLDDNGWADIDELIRLAGARGKRLTRPLIEEIVATSDKKRFVISEDQARIRASQGHSISVDLGLAPQEPPALLYHGTASRFVESIQQQGLVKGSRQHVHLSMDVPTAIKTGQRHGKPVLLKIAAGDMHRAGHLFYVSANGVWLTESVPAMFIEVEQ